MVHRCLAPCSTEEVDVGKVGVLDEFFGPHWVDRKCPPVSARRVGSIRAIILEKEVKSVFSSMEGEKRRENFVMN